MSSTVTTATVSTITTAITMEGLGQVLSLVALIVLAAGLLAREVLMLSNGRWARAWARGLDIGNAPMLVVFALIAAINLVVFAQTQ